MQLKQVFSRHNAWTSCRNVETRQTVQVPMPWRERNHSKTKQTEVKSAKQVQNTAEEVGRVSASVYYVSTALCDLDRAEARVRRERWCYLGALPMYSLGAYGSPTPKSPGPLLQCSFSHFKTPPKSSSVMLAAAATSGYSTFASVQIQD